MSQQGMVPRPVSDCEGDAAQVKVQGPEQLVGQRVYDRDGRRVGRVVEVTFGQDAFAPVWLIVVVSLVRREVRAVPAGEFSWRDAAGLTVPVTRRSVLLAPPLAGATLDPALSATLEEYYRVTRE